MPIGNTCCLSPIMEFIENPSRSHFFDANGEQPMVHRSLTGTSITHIGQSNFVSKPSVAQLNASPPNLLLKGMAVRADGGHVKFPQMKEFAHFHYDSVDIFALQLSVNPRNDEDQLYSINVRSNQKSWVVMRGFEDFKVLDRQLHFCIFDRKFSGLPDLDETVCSCNEEMDRIVESYLAKYSGFSGNFMNCGTVLNFFEVDNRGNHVIVIDNSAINIPAVAAAHAVRRYSKQAPDELSLEVGDMVSVIDKPRVDESTWWRGKKGFEVGFFPAECVEIIGIKVPHTVSAAVEGTKPVLRKRGKLITYLRMFFSNRPPRTTLKQSGIVKERVFGCDLGEHLLNSGLSIPQVLKGCCEAIELHGQIDGIYRLSGVASSIQKLRAEFDECAVVSLDDEEHLLDLHTITAVLKMYFRELPNPLLTFQLYEAFGEAVQHKGDDRLNKLKCAVERLPPPHYRSAKYLFCHLNKMTRCSTKTGMDSRNLAIVWSPNLMRSKAMEGGAINGATMLQHVSIQATVTEALISHYDYIFGCDDFQPRHDVNRKPRPSSVAVSSPSRLLTLTEAQDRLSGEGGERINYDQLSSSDILPVFHTVIDFADDRRKMAKDNGLAGSQYTNQHRPSVWKTLFNRSRTGSLTPKKTEYADVDSERTKSVDSEETITDSDISHLSRRLLSASSNSGSMPNVANTADEVKTTIYHVDDPLDVKQYAEAAEASSLTKSNSHESFFDPAVSATEAVVERTPGVVFRPAYTKEPSLVDILPQFPKATWKRTNNPQPPSPPSPPSRNRIPYISPAHSINKAEQVLPVSLSESPGAQRKRGFGHSSVDYQRLTNSSEQSFTSSSESFYQEENTGSGQGMGELMAVWEDSEAQMAMNQAQQARLSRSICVATGFERHSDRAKISFADDAIPNTTAQESQLTVPEQNLIDFNSISRKTVNHISEQDTHRVISSTASIGSSVPETTLDSAEQLRRPSTGSLNSFNVKSSPPFRSFSTDPSKEYTPICYQPNSPLNQSMRSPSSNDQSVPSAAAACSTPSPRLISPVALDSNQDSELATVSRQVLYGERRDPERKPQPPARTVLTHLYENIPLNSAMVKNSQGTHSDGVTPKENNKYTMPSLLPDYDNVFLSPPTSPPNESLLDAMSFGSVESLGKSHTSATGEPLQAMEAPVCQSPVSVGKSFTDTAVCGNLAPSNPQGSRPSRPVPQQRKPNQVPIAPSRGLRQAQGTPQADNSSTTHHFLLATKQSDMPFEQLPTQSTVQQSQIHPVLAQAVVPSGMQFDSTPGVDRQLSLQATAAAPPIKSVIPSHQSKPHEPTAAPKYNVQPILPDNRRPEPRKQVLVEHHARLENVAFTNPTGRDDCIVGFDGHPMRPSLIRKAQIHGADGSNKPTSPVLVQSSSDQRHKQSSGPMVQEILPRAQAELPSQSPRKT